MAKSISIFVITLAVFGAVSTLPSSYVPKRGWPYSLYTTTETPAEFTTTTTTTTTPAPPSELQNEDNGLDRYIIIQDPKTGAVVYIPLDLFLKKSGNSIREKRSTSWRSRAFQLQEPRIRLDEVPQIDDVIENDEYDQKYSDYLRSASQYQPQVYYDDNIAISAEDQQVQIQVYPKDTPRWQPSDAFKAFFPNYRYGPNKIVYTYSSVCSNGCMNNKKYYNPPENISEASSTTLTSTTTTTTEAPVPTTSELSILEDVETTAAVNTEEPDTTTQSPDYVDSQNVQVPPA